MRIRCHLFTATTLIFFGSLCCHGKILSSPTDDLYIKFMIDSTLTSDSIVRLDYVKYHLNRAFKFLNTNQLDSARSNAEQVTRFDINLVPGDLLAQAFYILGKVNRLSHRSDLALKNYLVAIQKLRYIDNAGIKSEICQELAIMYYENGWISKSIEKYLDAYKTEIQLGNETNQIELLHALGDLYEESNDYNNAILYQEKLLALLLKQKNPKAIELMKEISDNYVLLKKYQIAIYLQSQVLDAMRESNNLEGLLSTLLEIVKIYREQPDYEKLNAYITRFNSIYNNLKKKEITAKIKSLKGESLLILGGLSELWGDTGVDENFETAILYYDSAFFLFSLIPDLNKAVETYLLKADVFYKMKDYKSVIDNCLLAIQIYKEEHNYERLVQSYHLIADSYMNLDRFRLAYQAQMKYQLYSDSLDVIRNNEINALIAQLKGNENRNAFQNLEQTMLQKELDTLSDALLHLEIDKQKRDIELLVKEKSLNDLALKNEQLKNRQVTNENILLQQKIEADLRENEILNLQAERSRQESEIKNQQIYQIKKEQQIYTLEQDKKVSDLQLQKAKAQKTIYLLSIIISFIVLISVIKGYLNIRKSRSNIVARNKFIEEHNIKLKELNQEKNRLIRIVAHDLKNPLTSALTLSDLLYKKDNFSSSDEKHSISLIRRSLKRMQEMISKILDLKAINAEKLNLEIEPINVKQIIHYVVELFASKAEKKHMQIQTEVEEVYIGVDRDYFIQILENLISNALKFSPMNTRVSIKAVEYMNTCLISVSDEGPGFKRQELQQLFLENKIFSTRPTNGESSNGLGLSIVKKYVDAMDGKVWCESVPEKGSTFYVEFEKATVMA